MGSEPIATGQNLMPVENIQSMIHTIRGIQVMIDRDLATVYDVEAKRLNEQVKRNIERFPESFRFQLTQEEYDEVITNGDGSNLRSQIATSSGHGGRRYLPYVFSEQGISMLFALLNYKIRRC
ncbi:ORF6N domain-containing protein [bacterium]|nr:ORF6N domain-containing protein [bacterium]